MVGRRVAGEAEQLEPTGAGFAELLHADWTPTKHRRPANAECVEQPVGRLRRAREGAGEDLGVRDGESLFAAGRGARERRECREIRRVERTTTGEGDAFRYVRCVHPVEE